MEILEYIKGFTEVQQFGWNALTVSAIGTLVLSLIQIWGLRQQIKQVRATKSSMSISSLCMCYYCVHFFCFAVYGVRNNFLTMTVAGVLLGLAYVYMVDALIDTNVIIDTVTLTIAIVAAAATFAGFPQPYDKWLMTILYFTGTFFLCDIPYRMWRNRSVGTVNFKFLATLDVTIIFWAIYSYSVDDMMLFVNCTISLVALAISMLFYCFGFSPRREAANGSA